MVTKVKTKSLTLFSFAATLVTAKGGHAAALVLLALSMVTQTLFRWTHFPSAGMDGIQSRDFAVTRQFICDRLRKW
jgi:hypothetical protein